MVVEDRAPGEVLLHFVALQQHNAALPLHAALRMVISVHCCQVVKRLLRTTRVTFAVGRGGGVGHKVDGVEAAAMLRLLHGKPEVNDS